MSHHIITLGQRDVECIIKCLELHLNLCERAHEVGQIKDEELLGEAKLISQVAAIICNPVTLGEPMAVDCTHITLMAMSLNDSINQAMGLFAQRLLSDEEFLCALHLLRDVGDQLIHGEEVHAPEVPC